MYRVSVSTSFTAQHHLTLADGTVERPHEHDWGVQAAFAGSELDSAGLLVDFDEIDAALRKVLGPLEGADLNLAPLLGGLNPSTEHVARVIYEALRQIVSQPALLEQVMVEEAPGCTAAYWGSAPLPTDRPPVDGVARPS